MTSFTPMPLNTSAVQLPADLQQLLEKLAENTHNVWAAQRMSQGWTYGAARNDATRQHPCLVPYDQLPELEKEYDRKTAGETLKAIMTLGFRITRDGHS